MKRKRPSDLKDLACGCYISHSEIFKEYHGKFDKKKDMARISKIVGESKSSMYVERMMQLNRYSQRFDVGGWRTSRDGNDAIPKIHKKSNGDYYVCPYS